MRKLERLLELTRSRTPWALARFNDGEMRAIQKAEGSVARGDQPCTKDLQTSLQWAIGQRRHRLYMGLPCGICFPGLRFIADRHTATLDGNLITHAVVQTNRNLETFRDEMPRAMKSQRIWWVAGSDQKTGDLPFKVNVRIDVSPEDAYTKNRDGLWSVDFEPDSIVFLSCGPLATVAAVHLFVVHPKTTFIDVGSVWDPETRGVSHKCHEGTLKPCRECN